MFKKIVSNISFSPALVGQLSFYAKRLRKEESTRRLGLIFVALALIVQSLAVFQPPESANASNQNDFVSGGIGKSIDRFLAPYDANVNNLRDVMDYTGITRQEIASAQYGSWLTGATLSWGFQPRYSAGQGEQPVAITDPSGNAITTVYSRPNKLFYRNSSTTARVYGFIGQSQKMGWFAIVSVCGNLITTSIPPVPTPPVTPPVAPPVTPKVTPPVAPPVTPPVTPPVITKITQSKTAVNISQGSVNATTVIAQASDRIIYTINSKNDGNTEVTAKLEDHLADTLEYANLIDNGGGTFDTTTKILTWPDVKLAPGATATRTFAISMLSTIPATAQGLSDPSSYDCIMTNVFGNDITIKVNCSTPKVVEQVVTQLPHTGPTENLLFAGIVLGITTYFYARARQVKKEVRLIRRSLNAGTI